MALFVDPNERRRLEFGDDHEVVELRGEWIEVLESVGDADWQEIAMAAMTARQDTDWELAFSGRAGIERMARWITKTSFRHPRHGKYPESNLAQRRQWLADVHPRVAAAIRKELDAHVERSWQVAQPEADPKAAASPDPE